MNEIDLKNLEEKAKQELEQAVDLASLGDVFNKYLGKKGELNQVLRSLGQLSESERVKIGSQANNIKNILEEEFKKKKSAFVKTSADKANWIDITVPGKKPASGHLHPLTLVNRKCVEIFQSMGFSIVQGPELETEWYNFDALNVPTDHPAREMHDTFWIKGKSDEKLSSKERLLMRTHTSPVQVRYMEKHNPPLRIIIPGKIFRAEATDASHETNFYHLEGLMVGKTISAANFMAVIQEFYRKFFSKPVTIRLIPSFFPFVEPGFQVDMSCVNCEGKGCPSCGQTGWLEMMGAGMVHPNVFKSAGLNPKDWQGFAFGMGIDRLAMMKYKINDIRLFHSGDLKFLQQF